MIYYVDENEILSMIGERTDTRRKNGHNRRIC